VLLIEDDMISREVIATVLTMDGYTLHTANNGSDALRMLDSGACTPQVILMDVRMEGLSGTELISSLRGRTRAWIYGMSVVQPPDELKSAVDGFLLKPFAPEALQKLLSQHKKRIEQQDAPPEEPLINAVTLSQFRQMMPEASVRQIYSTVASDLEERSATLEKAIADRNADEVRRLGHAIKGGCGMAGVQQASRLGALLETESDDLNNSVTIVRQLRHIAEGLKRMLDVEFPT